MENNTEREELLMQLVSLSGSAHSCAIEAIRFARAGDFEAAGRALEEGGSYLRTAHDMHFQMLKEEMAGTAPAAVTLFTVHAQDHFMNAQTTSQLAREMVEMCKELSELKRHCKKDI